MPVRRNQKGRKRRYERKIGRDKEGAFIFKVSCEVHSKIKAKKEEERVG